MANLLTESQIQLLVARGYPVDLGQKYWKTGKMILSESAIVAQIKKAHPAECRCTSDGSIAMAIVSGKIEDAKVDIDWAPGFEFKG